MVDLFQKIKCLASPPCGGVSFGTFRDGSYYCGSWLSPKGASGIFTAGLGKKARDEEEPSTAAMFYARCFVLQLDMYRSPGVKETALEWALRREATDMIELLVNDMFNKKEKPARLEKGPPVTLMQATGTGQ